MDNESTSKENYYGTKEPEGLTYLEFGGIDLKNSKKEIWDFKTDQDAYDLFMLARYAKEIIAYQDCKEELGLGNFEKFLEIYKTRIHTKDFFNTILTWVALGVLKKKNLPLNYYELGFTLFGCIEAYEACKIILPSKLEVNEIHFSGNEISYLMSELATKLHSDYKVSYSLTGIKEDLNCGLFFSKGVTLLYALKDTKEFMHYLNTSKIGIFDYNFSLGRAQSQVLGTGKKITYLSLEKFKEVNKNSGSNLYIRKSDLSIDKALNRMRCYCLWGEDSFIKDFLYETDQSIDHLIGSCPKEFTDYIIGHKRENLQDDYININDLDI